MKKFISALTSLVIAATALGGTAAFSASAINEKVDKTIIDIRSGGKNEITAKAGDKINVDVYVPQSAGFNSASGMFAINDGQPTGKNAENPYAFDNYGFKITAGAMSSPNALNSGYATYQGKLEADWDDEDANEAALGASGKAGSYSEVYYNDWSFIYMCDAATSLESGAINVDAYGEFAANGNETFKTFKPAFTWDDKAAWAYDYTWMTLTLEVPEGIADGKYVFDLYRDEYVNVTSRKDKYEYEQDPTWNTPSSPTWDAEKGEDKRKVYMGQTGFSGAEGKGAYDTNPLTIVVGNPTDETTPAATTTTTSVTTSAPTTTSSQGGDTQTTPAIPAGTVAFDLIAREGTQSFDGKYNVFEIEPSTDSRTVKVDWVVSSDGVEFAGINYEFAFPAGTFKSVMNGTVYDGDPTYQLNSDKTAIDITNVSAKNLSPKVGAKVMTFNLTIPAGEGEYIIEPVSGGKAAVVDYNGKDVKSQLNPIKIKIGNSTPGTTKAPETTTAGDTNTTSATTVSTNGGQTQTTPQIPAGTVAFDLNARDGVKTFDGKYNVFTLEKAADKRTVKVDWVVSSEGVEFAGVNYQFSMSDGIFKNLMNGKIYDGDPTYQLNDAKTEIDIANVSPKNLNPAVGSVIATFNLTIPAGEGEYIIEPVAGGKAAVVDYNGKDVPAQMNPIKIVVADAPTETTAAAETTTTAATTTTADTTTSKTTASSEGATTTTTSATTESQPIGELLLGDTNCDGKVTIADVVLLNKGLTNLDKINTLIKAQGQKNADVDQDGKLSTKDSTLIKQFLAELIDKF